MESVEVVWSTGKHPTRNFRVMLVGTPGLGYPLLLCLGKSLVVILNYVLTAEQPDPCGLEPYSPGKRPRTRSPLGEVPVTPHVPEEVALSQNSWGPRTSQGVPDPRRVPDPHILSGPSAGREQTLRLSGSGAATCPQAQARARAPSFLGKARPPTAFNAGDVKCALPQQSPRRLLPGCTADCALPRRTVQPLAPPTPRALVCYAS